MSDGFYGDARLYDRVFPGDEDAQAFYRAQAEQQGGSVLELGCGTGQKLIPIAAAGLPCTGLEPSAAMLDEARRKADELELAVEWVQGDMRDVDLGRTVDLVVIASNTLLHLREAADLVSCLGAVRRHLAPGGRLVLDVFTPDVQLLAAADGVRRTREALSFTDPDRGGVRVDVAETYDAHAQVTRGTWWFSTDSDPDFHTAPLEMRSIFPQELPLLLALAGLRLVQRYGHWDARPFTPDAAIQVCVCTTAD